MSEKKMVAYRLSKFKNKRTGEIIEERMGIKFDDGSWQCSVYNASEWKFISSKEVNFNKQDVNVLEGETEDKDGK